MAFNASSSMGFPHGPFAGDTGGSLEAAAANRGCFSKIESSICSNAASSAVGCSLVMALGLRMLGIEQDGAGDKLRFAPPLLLQKLRYRPLLGVLQIELQGEPARLFLLAHAGHLLLWAI